MKSELNGRLKAPSVLIADDKPDNLRLMCDILMEQYWVVRPLYSGIDIMQEVLNAPPDLIILDVMMQRTDSYKICSQLKENPATRHIPVVIMTSIDDPESLLKGSRAGADDFICKPVSHREIQTRLQNLIHMKKQWDMEIDSRSRLERKIFDQAEKLRVANKNLDDANEKLLRQGKMATVGMLMAGIAHEINNPAAFISSNLESLGIYTEHLMEFIALQDEVIKASCISKKHSDELVSQRAKLKIDRLLTDAPALIRESVEGADKIKLIARDVKCFSRNDDTKKRVSDINECLRSALRIAGNEIKYKGNIALELGDIPQVPCYPQQLSQVFLNLLINAAHAIENDGLISVKSWVDDGYIRVSISDNGCGIPEENMERIFEPLFTTKDKEKGTGLGLSICSEIIRRQGGEISVNSRPGEGATFTVSIPLPGDVA